MARDTVKAATAHALKFDTFPNTFHGDAARPARRHYSHDLTEH